MTSHTRTRLWDSAVVCRRSIASVAIWTAVWKPNVKSVAARSLSIVFGTPTTGMPSSCSLPATPRVSSPPIGISASRLLAFMAALTLFRPSSTLYTLVRDDPRIVPPRCRMPRVLSSVSSTPSLLMTPAQPCRKPQNSCPWALIPLRTTPRMTAFSPGQSPPPVSTPILMPRSLGVHGLPGRFVVPLRQPAEAAREVPVALAEQLHRGREQHRAHDRRVQQDGHGEADAHLL